jgi:aspartyl-tRNA(Asn)/glutamyl-tRNA(Gln) amidotransferase subunit A
LEVFEEEALVKARELDQRVKQSKPVGKLAGLIVGIKDMFCYAGHTMTSGSKILDGFQSNITATVLKRLLEEDAIIIGRQNCDEFGMGSSNENSAFGICKNPIDPSRVPGGSSGGSACAVAANMCMISLGSDTGGSTRQPASFCGVYGLKPTYSRLSRYGLTAYASSFDTVGLLGNNPEDIGLVMEVIGGYDENDNTSSKEPIPTYSDLKSTEKVRRVALIDAFETAEGYDPVVRKHFEQEIKRWSDGDMIIEHLTFPYLDYLLPVYYILTSAEASANLSRYDGIRYGFRETDYEDLTDMYKKTRTHGFGKEVLRRIMLGTFVLSASYHDAFYVKAQRARNMIKSYTENILRDFDFIITPTSPTTAFKIGEKANDPLEMYHSDVFTVLASVTGLPSISVPFGKDENGLPFGLQIIAGAFDEHDLLKFSKELA